MVDSNNFNKIDAFFKTLEDKTKGNLNNNDLSINSQQTVVLFFKSEVSNLPANLKNKYRNRDDEETFDNTVCYMINDDDIVGIENKENCKHIKMAKNGEIYFLQNYKNFYLDDKIKRLNYIYTDEEIQLISSIFIAKYTANFHQDNHWNFIIEAKHYYEDMIPNVGFYYQESLIQYNCYNSISSFYQRRPQKDLSSKLLQRNYNVTHEEYYNIYKGVIPLDMEAEKQKLISMY